MSSYRVDRFGSASFSRRDLDINAPPSFPDRHLRDLINRLLLSTSYIPSASIIYSIITVRNESVARSPSPSARLGSALLARESRLPTFVDRILFFQTFTDRIGGRIPSENSSVEFIAHEPAERSSSSRFHGVHPSN